MKQTSTTYLHNVYGVGVSYFFCAFSLHIFIRINFSVLLCITFYSTYKNILPTQNVICQNYERATFSLIYQAKARPNQPFTKLLYMCNHKIVMPVTENSWSIFLNNNTYYPKQRQSIHHQTQSHLYHIHIQLHINRENLLLHHPPSIFTQTLLPCRNNKHTTSVTFKFLNF